MRRGRGTHLVPAGLAGVVVAGVLAGCTGGGSSSDAASGSSLPQGSETVTLDSADFTVDITNKFWPMKPGDRYVYQEKDFDGALTRDEVTVLDRTEKIAGVETRVVHDLATVNGQTVEDTIDWYAQDSAGNLWYFGEQTAEFENGVKTSTEGSWVAGQDGAQPGVLLPAAPKAGMSYRQEYRKGEAEDRALILSTDEKAQTPTGKYDGALLTRDTTPLEPDLVELKWYAPDVGPVLTLTPSGEATREQLVEAPSR